MSLVHQKRTWLLFGLNRLQEICENEKSRNFSSLGEGTIVTAIITLQKQWKLISVLSTFICSNNTVTAVTINKISHLFALYFYHLIFSFYFKIFLPIQSTIWGPRIMYIVVARDLVLLHISHGEETEACVLA